MSYVPGMGKREVANEWAASLRIQTNAENKAEFGEVSPERYVSTFLCSIDEMCANKLE